MLTNWEFNIWLGASASLRNYHKCVTQICHWRMHWVQTKTDKWLKNRKDTWWGTFSIAYGELKVREGRDRLAILYSLQGYLSARSKSGWGVIQEGLLSQAWNDRCISTEEFSQHPVSIPSDSKYSLHDNTKWDLADMIYERKVFWGEKCRAYKAYQWKYFTDRVVFAFMDFWTFDTIPCSFILPSLDCVHNISTAAVFTLFFSSFSFETQKMLYSFFFLSWSVVHDLFIK